MNNSARVLRELTLVVKELANRYRPDDVVAIGLRYVDRSVDKIECFHRELLGRLFMIVDGKDPVCDEHKETSLWTIFVCDSSGSVIYDSQDYKPSKQKAALRFDGDRRLLAFRGLAADEKEQVVALTVEQIYSTIDSIKPEDNLDKTTGTPDSAWGEMPWDNNQK